MKIGVKTYYRENFLRHFEDKADFFEIQAIQKHDYSFVKRLKLPIVIHAEHLWQGANYADKTKYKYNLKSINFAQETADMADAKKIIVHPGLIANENCSIQQAIDFIKDIDDDRIIIENMPPIGGRFCTTPKKLKQFSKATNKNICYDFSHSIILEKSIRKNYLPLVKQYIRLKPRHYHINGIKLIGKDHFSFKESEVNMKPVLKLFPKDAEITLEVTKNIKKTEYDLKFIKNIINELENPI